MSTVSAPSTGVGPEDIFKMASGFWVSKALFSALELGLFETLSNQPQTAEALAAALRLPVASVDRLVSVLRGLGLVRAESNRLSNTPGTEAFLVRRSPTFIGGIFHHFNDDLYPLWQHLPDALRSGRTMWKQAFGPDASDNPFVTMYADPARLEGFLRTMAALAAPAEHDFCQHFDFSGHACVMDVGAALGTLVVKVLSSHAHLRGITFDLPPVAPLTQAFVQQAGLADRAQIASGDMFVDPLPRGADLITLSFIVHDWDDDHCVQLLSRCFEALERNGEIAILEKVLHEDRGGPLPTALMSLNMLIATGGKERTETEYAALLGRAGFIETRVLPLPGPRDVVIARKP